MRSVICHGCGQRLEAGPDYTRRKMRCPGCGVMCELPPEEAPATAPKRAAAPPEAIEEEPRPRPRVRDKTPPPRREPPPRRAEPPPPPKPKPVELLPADPSFEGTQEDDDQPYALPSSGRFMCPDCHQLVEPGAELCPGCGLNLTTGEKTVRTFEPIRKLWVTGMPPERRWQLFLTVQVIGLLLGIIGAWIQGSVCAFVLPCQVFALVTAFLLGTYDRIDLKRTRKGKAELSKTWWICFIPRPPGRIRVTDYQGVSTGMDREVGCLEYWILIILLVAGIVPGILWWYFAMHRDIHFVALTSGHGYPEKMLYRGGSKDQREEIAAALEDIAGLPRA